jgi:Domain of Unknown Function (DUF1259)
MTSSRITRRHALALGGGVAAAGLAGGVPFSGSALAASSHVLKQHGKLPAAEIQKIIQAQGTISDGVLSIGIDRDDLGEVKGPLGVTFSGSFELDGALTFEPLGEDLAFFNGDLPLKASETQAFIDAVIANGLTFQAFHQHYIEMNPPIWFIHWRGVGSPLKLAQAVRNVLKATATQLPQTMPSDPKSSLDAKRLAKILGGDAQIGSNGVVTVDVSRRDRIVIGGVHASADSNISTDIEFKPRSSKGSLADVGPDFSMTGSEVQPVIALMRKQGWFVACLYNQETEESPQLYFSHMLKTGNAYTLAAEIRLALDKTDSE